MSSTPSVIAYYVGTHYSQSMALFHTMLSMAGCPSCCPTCTYLLMMQHRAQCAMFSAGERCVQAIVEGTAQARVKRALANEDKTGKSKLRVQNRRYCRCPQNVLYEGCKQLERTGQGHRQHNHYSRHFDNLVPERFAK